MEINRELTAHIAALSGIRLAEAELDQMTRDLRSVIGYMDTLEALDIASVAPMSHVQERVNYTREDAVRPSIPRGDVLVNAARKTDEYVVTPKTFG
ncbi:MAG: Asp-tRNA(Asn)/Glu-tRNA(Gln) amidotransferase subunit GatC [Oscillospiraceae bacterium]|jgi:aspartyl-tRNA(Asn)/glutamyl-tRNA(Gln) amidotransferase subunit C|nr:Asp-tRNA(Asn)/Glu-tRNA(Gln) amidotransferase subunit GatC [Oscillospiraceae bacterium]